MKDTIVLKNENNEDVTCDIVSMFSYNGKNYIIYKYENNLFASLYQMENQDVIVNSITDNSDFDIVDKYLESL